MMKCLKSLLFILLFTIFCSCGADKLKTKISTNQSGLTASGECSYTSLGPPVCGMDGKDYINQAHASCFKTAVNHAGHCVCSNDFLVCGSDGRDYTECEATLNHVEIVKYIPCNAVEN